MARKGQRTLSYDYFCVVVIGLITGFISSNSFFYYKWRSRTFACVMQLSGTIETTRSDIPYQHSNEETKLLLISVITTRQHLETRALAINRTWAGNVIGDVLFFIGGVGDYNGSLPVVVLEDVSDIEYPPRRKSFAMLEYISRHYGNRYHWFMRVDDDIFVYGEKLSHFLSTINGSQQVYMGHPGNGTQKETGHLGLHGNDPYCMGGTGIVFSRVTLTSIAGRLKGCLNNTVSNHEDTEIGRCLFKHLGITCTRASQFEYLFYQKYDESSGKWTDIVKSSKHLTRHPIKNESYIYKNYISDLSNVLRNLEIKFDEKTSEISELAALISRDYENPSSKKEDFLRNLNLDIPWSIDLKHMFYSVENSGLKEPSNLRGRPLTFSDSKKALAQFLKDTNFFTSNLRLGLIGTSYLRLVMSRGLQQILVTKDSNNIIRPFYSLQTFQSLRFKDDGKYKNATKIKSKLEIKQ